MPATKIGESFQYLGKYFDFNMSDKDHKQELIIIIIVIIIIIIKS
jgi:hypothetical protein